METYPKEQNSNEETFGGSNESYVVELENVKHHSNEEIFVNNSVTEIPGSVQKDVIEKDDIMVQNNVISKRRGTDATDADNVSEVYDISYTFNRK